MHEALGMARLVCDMLNSYGAQDSGAEYQIVVTDTAGNYAEIRFQKSHNRWIMDDDVNRKELNLRLRQEMKS